MAPARPRAWGKAVFDAIEWRRFETLVERLFQQAGFETTSQSHGADKGVGVGKIRDLRGAMAARQFKRGQFATTSTFTPAAITFARDNAVKSLDRDGLLGLIATRSPEEQAELPAVAWQGDHWRPTCVNCGLKLRHRTARKNGNGFWGCSSHPKCKTTMPMGSA